MQMLYIGVDVSAKQLDICCSDDKQITQIANTLPEIEKWLESLPQEAIIAMEVTSHYHLVLAEAAYRSGRRVYVLNPMEVKHYAQGVGRRTKNDRIDARLIRRYIQREHHELRAWQPMSQSQATINTLFNRRATLVKKRQSIMMACKGLNTLKTVDAAIMALQSLIDEMEQSILKEIRREKVRFERFKWLVTIPGLGKLSSAYLVNLFERTEFTCAEQVISFLGLDLMSQDSGQKVGRRRLSKRGPSEARRLLYNAAMAASKGLFKPIYEYYCQRMTKTQALVVMMRRLAKLAFGVWKSGNSFDVKAYKTPLLVQKG